MSAAGFIEGEYITLLIRKNVYLENNKARRRPKIAFMYFIGPVSFKLFFHVVFNSKVGNKKLD